MFDEQDPPSSEMRISPSKHTVVGLLMPVRSMVLCKLARFYGDPHRALDDAFKSGLLITFNFCLLTCT